MLVALAAICNKSRNQVDNIITSVQRSSSLTNYKYNNKNMHHSLHDVVASKDRAVEGSPAASSSSAMLLFSFFCSVANLLATSWPCASWAWSLSTVAVSLRTLFLILPRCESHRITR